MSVATVRLLGWMLMLVAAAGASFAYRSMLAADRATIAADAAALADQEAEKAKPENQLVRAVRASDLLEGLDSTEADFSEGGILYFEAARRLPSLHIHSSRGPAPRLGVGYHTWPRDDIPENHIRDFEALCRVLIAHQVPPTCRLTSMLTSGFENPLRSVIHYGSPDFIGFFLENLDPRDWPETFLDQSPLTYAVERANPEIFELVLSKLGDPDEKWRSNTRETALQHAVLMENQDLLEKLLDAGAMPEGLDGGISPLHAAEQLQSREFASILEARLKGAP